MENTPKYTFNELDDCFYFEVKNILYRMNYPTVEEIKAVDELQQKAQKIFKKKTVTDADKEKASALEDKVQEIVYASIETVNGEDAPIAEAIKSFSMRMQSSFYSKIFSEYYSLIKDEEEEETGE